MKHRRHFVIDGAVSAHFVVVSTLGPAFLPGRRAVATCLRAFRETADAARRRALWTAAYQRWLMWGFKPDDHDRQLATIASTELDYAVVAYAAECTDAIYRQLGVLENEWHASLVNCLTAWNLLLSQFQPYAHAMHCAQWVGDWLLENRHYYPFDLAGQDYLKMMYYVRA